MTRPSNFVAAYLSVVAGTLLFVMSVAFVSIPYVLKAHPGEAVGANSGKTPVASAYHLT